MYVGYVGHSGLVIRAVAFSGVPSKSAARGDDLKYRPIIYNSIRSSVIVGPYIKSKKSETMKFPIYTIA